MLAKLLNADRNAAAKPLPQDGKSRLPNLKSSPSSASEGGRPVFDRLYARAKEVQDKLDEKQRKKQVLPELSTSA